METFEAIRTKLDVRTFSRRRVDDGTKAKILEAARLTGSSMNSQHWRFIIVQEPKNLETLAKDSSTGSWVKGADFAVIVAIDPRVPGSMIDAGRVLQDMELAAWDSGVASGIFTGVKDAELRQDFGIRPDLKPAVVVGFGYPIKALKGKKTRKPIGDLVSAERYGSKFELK